MWIIAASAICGIAVVFAVHVARSQQRLSRELRALRSQVRAVSERLEVVARSAGEATTRSEVAGTVPPGKGSADEEELEDRRGSEPGDPIPVRGSRTIH
jgi:hypothetical protein